jgi:nitroreductase
MDVSQAIRGRRSIRRFESRDIPDDKLTEVLEAGRWAPSASNFQPWRFIVVRDEKVRKELARVSSYGKFMAQAPVVIAVMVDPSRSNHPVEDGAAATQNMLLAAHSLGLGSCWIGSFDSIWEDQAKKVLGIPGDNRLLSLIAMGYPAEKGTSSRKPLRDMVCYDRYTWKC